MNAQTYELRINDLAAKFAYAIAVAEGYFANGSLPGRINNPGDMKLGDRGHGVEQEKTIYATANDGWAALRRECLAILVGASHIYSVHWNMLQVAEKWTGNDRPGAWCKIVCEKMNIDPATTLASLVKGALNDEPAV